MLQFLEARARRAFFLVPFAYFAMAAISAAGEADVVNIYSYRQPDLIRPMLDAFTSETGIRTQIIFAEKGLEERIRAEGAISPADVILTSDISRLAAAKDIGVTQPLDDPAVTVNIPPQYRDSEGHWFGLTLRARVVFASRERVAQDTITYEELAYPKWKGRICTRSGQHVYNIGLIASMIAHHGEAWTETWLGGVKANLAVKPTGNDRAQAKAVHAGQCDIALGNTYYIALMRTNDKEPKQKAWADSIKVLFPNADGRGSHVNISGMALAAHAPHRDAAVKLMAYLASEAAQKLYAQTNHEYPVKAGVPVSEMVASFGQLNADPLPLSEIAKNRRIASELVDRVGYNDGPSS